MSEEIPVEGITTISVSITCHECNKELPLAWEPGETVKERSFALLRDHYREKHGQEIDPK